MVQTFWNAKITYILAEFWGLSEQLLLYFQVLKSDHWKNRLWICKVVKHWDYWELNESSSMCNCLHLFIKKTVQTLRTSKSVFCGYFGFSLTLHIDWYLNKSESTHAWIQIFSYYFYRIIFVNGVKDYSPSGGLSILDVQSYGSNWFWHLIAYSYIASVVSTCIV